MSPNDTDGMANNVDPDQYAPQSDLGLHCLPRHICPKTLDIGKLKVIMVFLFLSIVCYIFLK